MRYLIIVNLMDGQTVAQTVSALQVGRSTVYAVAKRFREHGEAALVDGREENGGGQSWTTIFSRACMRSWPVRLRITAGGVPRGLAKRSRIR